MDSNLISLAKRQHPDAAYLITHVLDTNLERAQSMRGLAAQSRMFVGDQPHPEYFVIRDVPDRKTLRKLLGAWGRSVAPGLLTNKSLLTWTVYTEYGGVRLRLVLSDDETQFLIHIRILENDQGRYVSESFFKKCNEAAREYALQQDVHTLYGKVSTSGQFTWTNLEHEHVASRGPKRKVFETARIYSRWEKPYLRTCQYFVWPTIGRLVKYGRKFQGTIPWLYTTECTLRPLTPLEAMCYYAKDQVDASLG